MRITIKAILSMIGIIIIFLAFAALIWWRAEENYGDGTCAWRRCVIIKEDSNE